MQMDFRYGLKFESRTKKLVFKSRNKKNKLVLIVGYRDHTFFSCTRTNICRVQRKFLDHKAIISNVLTSPNGPGKC